jgi:hypothetical protein
MKNLIIAKNVLDYLKEEKEYYTNRGINPEPLKNIFNLMNKLKSFPEIGKPYNFSTLEKTEDEIIHRIENHRYQIIRSLVVGNYIILYGIKNDDIHILYIKHHYQKEFH